jgi:hypothetical protein
MRTFVCFLAGVLFAAYATTSTAFAGVPTGGHVGGSPTMIYALGANGAVNVYDIHGRQRGAYQLSDTNGQWLCGDGRDSIFVVDTPNFFGDQLTEQFALGATQPSLMLDAGSDNGDGFVQYQCTVDFDSGEVAVGGDWGVTANAGLCLFPRGQTEPDPETCGGAYMPSYLTAETYDPAGNLWTAGDFNGRPAIIPPGNEGNWVYLPRGGDPSGVQIDLNGNLLLEEPNLQAIEIYPRGSLSNACVPNNGALCSVPLLGTQSPGRFLLASGSELFTLDSGKIYGFRYPQGGYANVTINFAAIGIAVFPRTHTSS